jgi:hypothetical protein
MRLGVGGDDIRGFPRFRGRRRIGTIAVMKLARLQHWITAAALALVIAGCGGQTFIGGLPVGDPVPNDSQFVDFAMAVLDDEHPDHAPVSQVAMFWPDFRSPDGSQILWARSGDMGDYVVALHLSDGSVHSYFVMCGVGLDTKRCLLGPPDLSK